MKKYIVIFLFASMQACEIDKEIKKSIEQLNLEFFKLTIEKESLEQKLLEAEDYLALVRSSIKFLQSMQDSLNTQKARASSRNKFSRMYHIEPLTDLSLITIREIQTLKDRLDKIKLLQKEASELISLTRTV